METARDFRILDQIYEQVALKLIFIILLMPFFWLGSYFGEGKGLSKKTVQLNSIFYKNMDVWFLISAGSKLTSSQKRNCCTLL